MADLSNPPHNIFQFPSPKYTHQSSPESRKVRRIRIATEVDFQVIRLNQYLRFSHRCVYRFAIFNLHLRFAFYMVFGFIPHAMQSTMPRNWPTLRCCGPPEPTRGNLFYGLNALIVFSMPHIHSSHYGQLCALYSTHSYVYGWDAQNAPSYWYVTYNHHYHHHCLLSPRQYMYHMYTNTIFIHHHI